MEKYVLFVVIGPIRHPELIPNVRSNGRKRRIVIKSLHNGRRRRRPRRSRYPQDDRGKKGVQNVVLRSTCGKKSAPVVTHLLRCSKKSIGRFGHIETGLSRCSAETTDLLTKAPFRSGVCWDLRIQGQAPPVGLEPTTRRLTAACSTN